jgi:Tol biopolymer transport system component
VYTLTPPEALVPLLPAGDDLQRVFLSPSGDFVGAVSGGFLALLDLDDPSGVVNVPDVPAVGDVAWSDVLTDTGGVRLAFVVLGEPQSLYVMRLGAEGVPPALIAQAAGVESPAWAGQARKIAFTVRGLESPRGGAQRRDVFVADFETGEYINITETFGPFMEGEPARPFGGTAPAWGPDGETLDFVWVPPDQRPDRGLLYRLAPESEPDLIMSVLEAKGQGWSGPRWSPDGSTEAAIAPVEERGGDGELWVSPAGAEIWAARSLPDQAVERFAWSPDGAYLAYEVPGDGIWVVPAAGGQPQRVVAVGKPYQVRRLRWLPGGQ